MAGETGNAPTRVTDSCSWDGDRHMSHFPELTRTAQPMMRVRHIDNFNAVNRAVRREQRSAETRVAIR